MTRSVHIKLFFVNTLKFVVAALGIYLLVVFVLCKISVSGKPLVFRACQGLVWKGGHTYERFKDFDREKKYDILIFGSSRANRGINPKIFEKYNYTSYNLATDDQTPLNTEVLVKQYVHPERCGLVIIDIYDKVFTQHDLESTSDLIQNLDKHQAAFNMACASRDPRSVNAFWVRMMLQNTPPFYKADTELYNGYRALDTDSISFNTRNTQYKTIGRYLEAFDNTLKHFQSINVPYLLVCQPMMVYDKNSNHDLLLKDINSILAKNNAVLHDYTHEKDIISIKDFADPCHLNINGAFKYSNFLLDHLIKKMVRPCEADSLQLAKSW